MEKHKVTQSDTTEDGNTKSSSRSRRYMYTINNPTSEDLTHINVLCKKAKVSVYQLEVGDEGTEHYQGYIEFKNALTFASMKKKLPRAHIEICRNAEASIAYCQKEEGRVDGPWTKGLPKSLNIIKNLYPWQQKVKEIIDKPADDRTILWIWEATGKTGKTQFCKYLAVNYNMLFVQGGAKDMKFQLIEHFKQDECNKDNLIVVMGLTRTKEHFVSYEGLESIKDGIFASTKYESSMCIFNSPHMIVMANFEPDMDNLSHDRWDIREIVNLDI